MDKGKNNNKPSSAGHQTPAASNQESEPNSSPEDRSLAANMLYIETYGCQMNVSDSEIVGAVMADQGWQITTDAKEAELILLNTCSIRDNAEQRIWKRLRELKSLKKSNPKLKIGILGCMAERLREEILKKEESVDIIAGPDAYRDLPKLMTDVESGHKAMNVILSAEETYADIQAVRHHSNGISAFISIMRGCENFCAYCVVPYVRGKERSRKAVSIIEEAKSLHEKGFKEITLLGQNVNSYSSEGRHFPALLAMVSEAVPALRIRFATSHPKDLSDHLLEVMAKYTNICRAIHLPVQSGSNRILKLMNRKYSREYYLERIAAIRKYLPDAGISTDIICGFPGETEEDLRQTLSLMQEVGYDFAYMFKYSERPNTPAAKKFKDDVPDDVKSRRLNEVIALQQELSLRGNEQDIGKTFPVLVESISKRSLEHLSGRNSQNKVLIFPKENYSPGDLVNVKVTECTSATLLGVPDCLIA